MAKEEDRERLCDNVDDDHILDLSHSSIALSEWIKSSKVSLPALDSTLSRPAEELFKKRNSDKKLPLKKIEAFERKESDLDSFKMERRRTEADIEEELNKAVGGNNSSSSTIDTPDTGVFVEGGKTSSESAGSETRIDMEEHERNVLGSLPDLPDFHVGEVNESNRPPPRYESKPSTAVPKPRKPPPSPRIIFSASTPTNRGDRRKRSPRSRAAIEESNSELDHDDDESDDGTDEEVVDSAVKRKSSHFWEKISGMAGGNNNKVGSRRSSDGERYIKSAKQVRNMRKKVSVTSQGKSRTNQEDLAMAIVEGNMKRISEVVEAYIALYKGNGFQLIMRYRYDIDPRNLVITCVDNVKDYSGEQEAGSPKGEQVDMFVGLSVLHIACVFDQEQVISYFTRYGNSILKTLTPSRQSLVHTCAWFGTLAPLVMLIGHGCNVNVENARQHQPLHLAVLRGHYTSALALIKAGADLEATDEGGNTPLHAAVLAGHFDCARELVNYDVDINRRNRDDGTPLHYASSISLVSMLMSNGADPNIEIKEQGSHSRSAFNLFLESMPEGCNEVLSSYLNSNGKSLGATDLEVTLDFDLFVREFESHPENKETGLLQKIVDLDQRDILKHPVCESFLHMKWLLVKNFFNAYLIFYATFLISITGLVFLEFSPVFENIDQGDKDIATWVFFGMTILTVALLLSKNIFLVIYDAKLYCSNYKNFAELLMIVICLVFVSLYYLEDVGELVVHVAAVALFFSWSNFTLLLGKLPSAGIYINMIVGISKDVLKFLTLYISTIVAFGLCFHILSHHKEHFEDPLSSTLAMLAMMVGEFNFGDVFTNSGIRYHWTTQVMFVLFLLFVSIIIMNLLIGLAISNISGQFESAGVYRLKMTVLLIRLIEDVVFAFKKICPCCFKHSAQLLEKLSKGERDSKNSIMKDVKIYIYPNQHGTAVYVKENGVLKSTKFVLPPWILINAFKLLRKENEQSAKMLMEASNRRKQDDKVTKLNSEIRHMKRDLQVMKLDLQVVANHVKRTRNPLN